MPSTTGASTAARCSRMRVISAGCVMAAMTRTLHPQRAQVLMSIANTRRSRCILLSDNATATTGVTQRPAASACRRCSRLPVSRHLMVLGQQSPARPAPASPSAVDRPGAFGNNEAATRTTVGQLDKLCRSASGSSRRTTAMPTSAVQTTAQRNRPPSIRFD